MKKYLIICLTFFLFSCFEKEKKENNVIKVGMSMDFPPFEFIKDGNPVGFDVDMIKEIGKILGKDVVLVDMNFDSLIASVKSGKVDIVVSGLSITEERKKNIDFTDCYFYPKIAILFKNEKEIKNIKDLSGKIIGVQSGTIMETYANSISKEMNIKIVSMQKNTYLIEDLKLGRVDGLFLESFTASEFFKQYSNKINFIILDIKNYQSQCYAMAISYKNTELKDLISDALDVLKKSHKLEVISDRWITKAFG